MHFKCETHAHSHTHQQHTQTRSILARPFWLGQQKTRWVMLDNCACAKVPAIIFWKLNINSIEIEIDIEVQNKSQPEDSKRAHWLRIRCVFQRDPRASRFAQELLQSTDRSASRLSLCVCWDIELEKSQSWSWGEKFVNKTRLCKRALIIMEMEMPKRQSQTKVVCVARVVFVLFTSHWRLTQWRLCQNLPWSKTIWNFWRIPHRSMDRSLNHFNWVRTKSIAISPASLQAQQKGNINRATLKEKRKKIHKKETKHTEIKIKQNQATTFTY